MLHPFDRLEIALGRSDGAMRAFKREPALERDLGAAVEFLGLRWLWWREYQEDLLDLLPGIEEWSALNLVRQLMARHKLSQPRSTRKPPLGNWSRGYAGACELSPLGSKDWRPGGEFSLFQERFQTTLRNAGAERLFSYALAGALEEMSSNAVEHASPPIAPIACFEVTGKDWQFTVTDVGRGALSSIRDNLAYAALGTEMDALKLVLQDGVSRTVEAGRGRGFTRVFKALVDRQARLRFRSGGASAQWEGESPTAQLVRFQGLPLSRAGFHITVAGPLGRG
jgi:hypothetical protein